MKKLFMLSVAALVFFTSVKSVWANPIYVDGNAQSVPVLMYHTFDEEPKFGGINTKAEEFRGHLTLLKENGYTAITNKELQEYQKGKRKLPSKPFMITIDDGYKSVYDVAYPILKELDVKATLFVITSHIESGERFDLPMVSWEQLKEMSDSGYLEIENHTHDLHWRGRGNTRGFEAMTLNETKNKKKITNTERKQLIIDDVTKAKKLIEENTGKESTVFAYPYGAYDKIVEEAVTEVGYEIVHTTIVGSNYQEGNSKRVKRIGINSNVSAHKILDDFNKYNKSVSKQATGWLNVHSDRVVASVWIAGDQYTTHTNMKEARFELYKRNSNGSRTFIRNFGEYVDKPHQLRKTVTMEDNSIKPGEYSLKMIATRNDGVRDFVWKEFKK